MLLYTHTKTMFFLNNSWWCRFIITYNNNDNNPSSPFIRYFMFESSRYFVLCRMCQLFLWYMCNVYVSFIQASVVKFTFRDEFWYWNEFLFKKLMCVHVKMHERRLWSKHLESLLKNLKDKSVFEGVLSWFLADFIYHLSVCPYVGPL